MVVKEQQCLNSLAVSNAGYAFGNDKSAAHGTCEWILSIEEFNAWRKGLPPLLWISGEFGYGKIMLVSFLQNRVLGRIAAAAHGQSRSADTTTICGFFCGSISNLSTNSTALLQGLMYDVVIQRHDLMHHAVERFQPSRSWSYDTFWETFRAILDDPCLGSTCVLINALDECEGGVRFHQHLTD